VATDAARPAAPTAAAPAPQAQAPTQRAARPDVVRVSNTQGLAGALQVAIAKGYFQEQGIDIQREEFGNAAEAVVPLSRGDLDSGSIAPNASFFNALGRGVRLTLALAGTQLEAAGRGLPLMVRLGPNGPVIRELADLRGKRVAHNQRGVVTEWALERMLGEVGLTLADVQTEYMPFPDVMAALGGSTIDASIMPEPFATVSAERDLAEPLVEAGDYFPGAQLAVQTFSDRFAHQRPEVARRFAVAYLQGTRDYMDAMELGRDRETVIAILSQASGFPASLLDKAGYFPVRRDGRVNTEALHAMLDWLVQHNYVPTKPDIGPLIDTQFADHARGVLDGAAERRPGTDQLSASRIR
jgi:NitT/TauT family transport system substrate-binding protein